MSATGPASESLPARKRGAGKPATVRGTLQGVFQEEFSADYLREVVQEIKGSTKGVKADVVCKYCGKRQYTFVQVPDWDKILVRAMDLLEQTEGRPGTLSVEGAGVTLILERSWPT